MLSFPFPLAMHPIHIPDANPKPPPAARAALVATPKSPAPTRSVPTPIPRAASAVRVA